MLREVEDLVDILKQYIGYKILEESAVTAGAAFTHSGPQIWTNEHFEDVLKWFKTADKTLVHHTNHRMLWGKQKCEKVIAAVSLKFSIFIGYL